jgi:hypothetical protein
LGALFFEKIKPCDVLFFRKQYKYKNLILSAKMNLLLDLKNVSTANVFFMETKPNMLFDGIFTKINYCEEFFTMYGIYINISTDVMQPKIDTLTMNALVKLETELLNMYGKSKPLGSKMVFKLSEFLQTKFTIKDKSISLKISGIWENRNNEYGLSFKL